MHTFKMFYTFLLLTVFTFGIGVKTYAATGDLMFANKIGGAGVDRGNDITTDAAGNIYTVGSFEGTVDFDPGAGVTNLSASGDKDIFITKYDSAGNLIWAKAMGGNSTDSGNKIAVDAAGNVYTTGDFLTTADFDPGAGVFNIVPPGGSDIFISKLDSSGNFVWAKAIGTSTASEDAAGIGVDSGNNVYITGYIQVGIDFDPGAGTTTIASLGMRDVFVLKLDSSGNFVWVKMLAGTAEERPSDLFIDASDNIYTMGYTIGTIDLDPGVGTSNVTAPGVSNVFISKLNAAGNFVWGKSFVSSNLSEPNAVTVDSLGNVYTTGYSTGPTDFDPGAGNSTLVADGAADAFISKLDSSGNFVWAKNFANNMYSGGNGIAVDSQMNVITTGYFASTTDFDPGMGVYNLTAVGVNDIFVSKLDSSGNLVWAKSAGVTSVNVGTAVAVDGSDKISVTGFFYSSIDLDMGPGISTLTSAGSTDAFVFKLDNDSTAPVLSTPSSIGTVTDATPDVTFTSSEGGTITYSGDCASLTTTVTAGGNSITLNTLPNGVHANCSITVTDSSGNRSTVTIPSFTINVAAGAVVGGSPIYGCKDAKAINYQEFAAHDAALCRYDEVAVVDAVFAPTVVQTTLVKKITFARDLQMGSVGGDVKMLQNVLVAENAGPSAKALAKNGITNYFGNLTKMALKEYQKAERISPASGVFGPKTRMKMNSLPVIK